jgi:hypothetical protein
MMSWRTDNIIAELLDDPVVRMVMQADNVDRQALAAELSGLARRLEGASRVAAAPRSWAGRDFARSIDALPSAHLAVAKKTSLAVCGAHC